MDVKSANPDLEFDETELKGFSRSVAEIEWLLLVLVLLYYVAPDLYVANENRVLVGMGAFAAFILSFRYLNFYRREARWKIALETWAMIGFITWTLMYTGKIESPLLNLYLLVVITAGLTLGKLMTLLELLLITTCYLWMGQSQYSTAVFSMGNFSQLMAKFSPFLLVAYLTTMLSADLHYAKNAFQKLSQLDELTGVYNRRAFNKVLEQELSKATRYSRPFSLLAIDADHLKATNDRHGHETGDRLLQLLADTVRSLLRSSDVLARVGGDEFAVLMPETDLRRADDAAQRILAAARNASLVSDNTRVELKVSIGVSSFPVHGRDTVDLLQKADAAMYQSKQKGGNCVTSYSEVGVNVPA
ncbi:MAG: GGDEF domain-containing protein [Gammaproteobacteria bacterium]|nr:GGDEF domain-containing protein [Gammaproteobacteria bacterium]